MRLLDLTGRRFGRLVVIERGDDSVGANPMPRWWCKCDCGKTTLAYGNNLRRNHTKSCGCLLEESRVKHGACLRSGMTNEYKSYEAARQRCNNPNSFAWARYGGRGIQFKFETFQEFYAALGPKPTPQHTVDRWPNRDGHYEAGNVRWATRKEQSQNISANPGWFKPGHGNKHRRRVA